MMLKLLQIFRSACTGTTNWNILKRYNSFQSAPVPPPEELPKYEVCKDEKLWQYVERLLPDRMIPPAPTVCNELPSGWKPQKLSPDMPYVVERTRNHMLPVYLNIQGRGERKRTIIKNIHGDIGLLAKDIETFLRQVNSNKEIGIQINEMAGKIKVQGDHVNNIKLWLFKRNY